MKDDDASPIGPLVTGSEIARLAGVTRAAVSNWRRRYDDFPAQVGGAANSPLYALAEVQVWLDRQRKGQEVSPEVELWQAMRAAFGEQMTAGLAEVAAMSAGARAAGLPDDVATRVEALLESEGPVDLRERADRAFHGLGQACGVGPGDLRARGACRVSFRPRLPADATVFDPAAESAVLLLSVAAGAGMRCRGQEIDADSARFAQLRADLHGSLGCAHRAGDSLRADAWPDLKADLGRL